MRKDNETKKYVVWFLIILMVFLCVGLLHFGSRKPFGRLKTDDIYYACLYTADQRIIFLEADELEKFVELMNDLKITPTFRSSEEYEQEGGMREWFVIERERRKGDMLRLQFEENFREEGKLQIVWINDKVYKIEKDYYERIDAFINQFTQ